MRHGNGPLRVLVAVDDDEASHDALELARRLVPADSSVLVVNVAKNDRVAAAWLGPVTGIPEGPPAPLLSIQEDNERYADTIVHNAIEELPHAETIVTHGDPGEAICALADSHDIDVIVVGTHQRSRWTRMWFGSVSRYVIDHANCSVLLVR